MVSIRQSTVTRMTLRRPLPLMRRQASHTSSFISPLNTDEAIVSAEAGFGGLPEIRVGAAVADTIELVRG